MIRLFVSDIDGCLSEPYRPYDRQRLDAIAGLAARGDRNAVPSAPPAFSLCTGRPYAYTEAVTQLLGLTVPVIFEAGAGLFDPVEARTRWHPDLDDATDGQLATMREWLTRESRGTSLSLDIGKRSQAGVIGPDPEDVRALLPRVRAHVASTYPDLTVSATPVSIDVMSRRLTKAAGLRWLADTLDLSLRDMAFIGDTEGDLGGLALVGRSFAPANASPEVRAAVDTVTDGRVAEGVLEAYTRCINENDQE